MAAHLRPLIEEIASQADEFLTGTKDRAQARAGISELITMDYGYLNPSDRLFVVTGVMIVLEAEEFFGTEYVGDPFREDEPPEE